MMTGYTGTGKHGNKYHYYISNGAKKKVCDKKTIHKDLIEERVVDACSKLLTKEKVKYIANQVYAACKKDGDLLSVKRLKAALKETESAIENLWVAMEKGQSVEMITERINKRETEKKELEKQLGIEIKKQSGMEYRDILSTLDYLRLLPNDNEYKRRVLINIFINVIYLYDRYFTLILNAGNRPISLENIPLDDIEETFANDYEGCSSNSLLVADAPPPRKGLEPFALQAFSVPGICACVPAGRNWPLIPQALESQGSRAFFSFAGEKTRTHGPIHSPGHAGQEGPPGAGCPGPRNLALPPGAKQSGTRYNRKKTAHAWNKDPGMGGFCFYRFSVSPREVYRSPLLLRLPSISSDTQPRLLSSSAHRPAGISSPVCGIMMDWFTRSVNTWLCAVP